MTELASHTGYFRAMGTTVMLRSVGVDHQTMTHALEKLQAEAVRWERVFSRFDPESQLNAVNRALGERVRVDRDFLDVLDDAITGYIQSGGRFDPAVIEALEQEGYDRTFEKIGEPDVLKDPPRVRPSESWKLLEIELDFVNETVRLPSGFRIDLGGIAKGAFVDRMMTRFVTWPGALLSAGGDLAVVGSPPDGSTWRIGIQHPARPDEDIATLSLRPGTSYAVATSSTRLRQWARGSHLVSHLIDPDTGRGIDIDTPSVTVVAHTVSMAEIETKAAIVSAARGAEIVPLQASLILLSHTDGTHETIPCHALASSRMDSNYATGSAA